MKKKLSVSVEEAILEQLEDFVKEGTFRNKSHLVEFTLNRFIIEKNQNKEMK